MSTTFKALGTIVFKPGFQVLTELAGSISILKKIQNDIVLVKKQKSKGCNQVFDRILPGHWFNLPSRPGHTGS